MNDFTKEELKELHAALCDRHENIEDFMPVQPLRIKIQFMIDNYCKHMNSNISFICDDCGIIL